MVSSEFPKSTLPLQDCMHLNVNILEVHALHHSAGGGRANTKVRVHQALSFYPRVNTEHFRPKLSRKVFWSKSTTPELIRPLRSIQRL